MRFIYLTGVDLVNRHTEWVKKSYGLIQIKLRDESYG